MKPKYQGTGLPKLLDDPRTLERLANNRLLKEARDESDLRDKLVRDERDLRYKLWMVVKFFRENAVPWRLAERQELLAMLAKEAPGVTVVIDGRQGKVTISLDGEKPITTLLRWPETFAEAKPEKAPKRPARRRQAASPRRRGIAETASAPTLKGGP
jgi:hypothetical protein